MSVLNEQQLKALGLTEGEHRRVIESHLELLRLTQSLAKAAQAHRTAMNPQEQLDTGWTLDECLEALRSTVDED